MQIGLFGGTLDPIHLGHLRSAEEVWETLDLDQIWFVPAASPPHKDPSGLTPFHHRYEMVRAALEGVPHFRISDLEARRKGPSYTIDTLRLLKNRYGKDIELYFVLGSDAFSEIDTWKDYPGLVDFANLVVICRSRSCWELVSKTISRVYPEYLAEEHSDTVDRRGLKVFSSRRPGRIIFLPVTPLEISSTVIRARLRSGRSARFLVPDKVLTYIQAKGLYG